MYGTLPNYRRILDIGGVATPADAAIVGDEQSVASQLGRLIDAGATDIWARGRIAVGADRAWDRGTGTASACCRELAGTS